MFVYVFKDNANVNVNTLYLTKNKKFTSNLGKARLFSRRCDAKNCLNHVNKDFGKSLELIECSLKPEIYYLVKCKLPYFVIQCDGKHWQPKVFSTKEAAIEYYKAAPSECNLHNDYFEIQLTAKNEAKEKSIQRPNWQDYFLGLALIISKRSHDIHRKHGCVIAHEFTHRILSTGYNGFPPGMKDSLLPTNRPDKHDWMIHAEVNAVDNMVLPSDSATAYVTGEPCTPCLIHLWRKGIKKVIHRNFRGSRLIDKKMRENKEILLAQTGMKVYAVEPDLSWLTDAVSAQ